VTNGIRYYLAPLFDTIIIVVIPKCWCLFICCHITSRGISFGWFISLLLSMVQNSIVVYISITVIHWCILGMMVWIRSCCISGTLVFIITYFVLITPNMSIIICHWRYMFMQYGWLKSVLNLLLISIHLMIMLCHEN
jgi:hypothetical protein